MKRSRPHPRWFRYSGAQVKALQHADATGQVVFVGDEPCSKNNAKKYGVIESHEAMYDYIQTCSEKAFYELVRDDRPSRLYLHFDAYLVDSSREVGFDKAIAATISLVFKALKTVGVRTERALVLESSGRSECREGKYKCSRHVHFPDAWFRSNFQDMAHFLRGVHDDALAVFHAAGFSVAWDTSVYSRNRPFRMLGCHKRGSKRVLRVKSGESSRDSFFVALVQPRNAPKDPICLGPAPKRAALAACSEQTGIFQRILEWFRTHPDGDSEVYACAPFASTGLFSGLRYRMNSRSKFCSALKRKHRHNNIYYTVDLRRGVVRQCCYSGATCKIEGCTYDKYKTVAIPRALRPQRVPQPALYELLWGCIALPRALYSRLRRAMLRRGLAALRL